MKWILPILAIVVIVFFIIAGYFLFVAHPTSSNTATSTNSNPFGSTVNTSPNSGNNTNPAATLPVTLTTGSTVMVPDFTKQSQPPTASASNGYQVAGTNTSDFQILYYPQGSGFLITLFTEPIGATRLEAEQALRTKLGLSDAQLCQLSVQVSVPNEVNSTYSGENLGLSFCPGSVKLP